MKTRILLLFATNLFCFCLNAQNEAKLYQYSTITALAKSYYDGQLSMKQLLKHGDFGLGTFNQLNGEMICLNGKIYQICADGKINIVHDSLKTPFSVLTHFNPQQKIKLDKTFDIQQLENYLDTIVQANNLIVAIKITGKFKALKTRSVKAQSMPYKLLVDAVKEQTVFDLKNTKGCMLGFRFPDAMDGVNVPGYHLHYIADDHKSGGHVINCTIEEATIEIQTIHQFEMELPSDREFMKLDQKKAKQEDIHKIEKQQ